MKSILEDAITQALQSLKFDHVDFVVEHPADMTHGDYATNVALVLAKQAGKNSRALAEEIITVLDGVVPEVAKLELAGPGFINITLRREYFTAQVAKAVEQGELWGRNDSLQGKRIMVEYTQPNPFKVFHIGHLMSNAIGEAISRIIEANGAEVFRANYQGDVGLHIGKTLWALGRLGYNPSDIEKVGEAYAFGHEQYSESEAAKTEIIAITKMVYAKDPAVMEAYTEGRKASLAHFDAIYARLGTAFDTLFFESQSWEKGKEVVEGHIGTIFELSEGAVVYKGEQDGLHTRVFINSEGVTTYEAKDVGLAFLKKHHWPFDLNITVTAVEQKEYFKVVFTVLGKIEEWFKDKLVSVSHGMMQLQDGKMSSRKGNVVTGESLLNEARDAAYKKITENDMVHNKEGTADAVGVAALKYMILRQSLGKNIVYDIDRALSFEGDSGPYLQYTYARIQAVLRKSGEAGVTEADSHMPETAYVLERLLYQYPEVVAQAGADHEPHQVVGYLTELAGAFNTFYGQEKIADNTDEYAPYKVRLTNAVGQTIKNGLWVLGIKAPERM